MDNYIFRFPKWPVELFITVLLKTKWLLVAVLIACHSSGLSLQFFCSVLKDLSEKLQMKDFSWLLIDSAGLDRLYWGWSSFFAACTPWPTVLQQGRLNSTYSDQNLLLLHYTLCITHFPHLSVFVSLPVKIFLSAPSLILSSLSLSLVLTRMLQSSYR